MTTDYCNDCGRYIEKCICPSEEDVDVDHLRKTPVDQLMKEKESMGRWDSDHWESTFNDVCNEVDHKDHRAASLSKKMKAGKNDNFEDQYKIKYASCRHCGTVTTMDQAYYQCPCCHKFTKSMPPQVKHLTRKE
jgi:rubrerythrin